MSSWFTFSAAVLFMCHLSLTVLKTGSTITGWCHSVWPPHQFSSCFICHSPCWRLAPPSRVDVTMCDLRISSLHASSVTHSIEDWLHYGLMSQCATSASVLVMFDPSLTLLKTSSSIPRWHHHSMQPPRQFSSHLSCHSPYWRLAPPSQVDITVLWTHCYHGNFLHAPTGTFLKTGPPSKPVTMVIRDFSRFTGHVCRITDECSSAMVVNPFFSFYATVLTLLKTSSPLLHLGWHAILACVFFGCFKKVGFCQAEVSSSSLHRWCCGALLTDQAPFMIDPVYVYLVPIRQHWLDTWQYCYSTQSLSDSIGWTHYSTVTAHSP